MFINGIHKQLLRKQEKFNDDTRGFLTTDESYYINTYVYKRTFVCIIIRNMIK